MIAVPIARRRLTHIGRPKRDQEGIAKVATNQYKVSLGNVKCIGALKNDNKSYGDKRIDHTESKTSYN